MRLREANGQGNRLVTEHSQRCSEKRRDMVMADIPSASLCRVSRAGLARGCFGLRPEPGCPGQRRRALRHRRGMLPIGASGRRSDSVGPGAAGGRGPAGHGRAPGGIAADAGDLAWRHGLPLLAPARRASLGLRLLTGRHRRHGRGCACRRVPARRAHAHLGGLAEAQRRSASAYATGLAPGPSPVGADLDNRVSMPDRCLHSAGLMGARRELSAPYSSAMPQISSIVSM